MLTGEWGVKFMSIADAGGNPTYALMAQSDAEGIANSSDLRIGLDESNRTMIICDRGDIDADLGLSASAHPATYTFNAAGTSYSKLTYETFALRGGASDFCDDGNSTFIRSYCSTTYFRKRADAAAGNFFTFDSDANIELTDTNAEQAWMYLEPKINMGTAPATGNYIGLLMDVTEVNLGDGSASGNPNALMDLRVSTVSKFRTYNTGYVRAGTLSAALADNDTFTTTIPDSWTGIVIVENTTDTTSGVYHLDGTTLAVINQNAGFTTAQGTNDKINVYIAANLLTVENTWAAAKTVKVFFIGT